MKLNHDCIRNLLLVLEEKLTGDIIVNTELKDHELLINFSKDDIFYSSKILSEQNFIIAKPLKADNEIDCYAYLSITAQGHEYLDNIRDPKVWDKVKQTLADKGLTATFNSIGNLAVKIIAQLASL